MRRKKKKEEKHQKEEARRKTMVEKGRAVTKKQRKITEFMEKGDTENGGERVEVKQKGGSGREGRPRKGEG